MSYEFFKELIEQIKRHWNKRKKFFPGYLFPFPKLNQSLKWRFDYINITNDKYICMYIYRERLEVHSIC